jgi:hypothetical protein
MTEKKTSPAEDKAAGGKVAPDWERIEADYRAGLLSVREIASANGVSHVAIQKRAKRDGWTRDLAAKIKAKADDLVTKELVTKEVTKEKAVTERQIVEAGAEAIARVRLAHRSDINKGRNIVTRLFDELGSEMDNLPELHELGEMMRKESESGIDKLNDLYRKVISMPGRVESVKKLSEALKNLIAMEREAYGLAEAQKIELTGKNGELINPMTPGDAYMHLLGKGNG